MYQGTGRKPYRERLRYDPIFALEVAYCTDKGIPHSKFLNWAPDDRAKALAWKLEESSRCQLCGTADWEWAENQYAYEPSNRFCKGCYLKDITNETSDTLPGTTVVLIPAAEAERDRES